MRAAYCDFLRPRRPYSVEKFKVNGVKIHSYIFLVIGFSKRRSTKLISQKMRQTYCCIRGEKARHGRDAGLMASHHSSMMSRNINAEVKCVSSTSSLESIHARVCHHEHGSLARAEELAA
jgi:hypothetical protein